MTQKINTPKQPKAKQDQGNVSQCSSDHGRTTHNGAGTAPEGNGQSNYALQRFLNEKERESSWTTEACISSRYTGVKTWMLTIPRRHSCTLELGPNLESSQGSWKTTNVLGHGRGGMVRGLDR